MATPKLALIPTGYKAGKLYSVLPESGVGDFTVVRATEATRVNEEGLIETMGANVPRLDYSGGGCPVLLTEGQRTNLVTYSEDFSDAAWVKTRTTAVANQLISPDGNLNAYKLSETADSGLHAVSINTSVVIGTTYNFSVFAKKGSSSFIQILFGTNNVSGNPYVNIDLDAGTFQNNGISSVNIENYGNGWYRCSGTIVISGGTNLTYYLAKINSLSATRASGFGGNVNNSIYIWGAMLEAGSYPTSYIKTEGSAVTRNGDQVYGAGDAATFNDSEGVLMAEISALANDGTNRRISISNGSTSDRVVLGYTASSNQLIVLVSSNSVSGVASLVNIDNSLQFNKIALKYKLNDFALWINGIEVLTDNSLNSPIGLNDLSFEGADNLNDFYGNTKQVQYFNTALTDSELETLTSWTSFIEMAQAQNYNII